MKRRSGSPSARRTTWSSQTFSASVLPIAFPPAGRLCRRFIEILCAVRPYPTSRTTARTQWFVDPHIQTRWFLEKLNLRFTV